MGSFRQLPRRGGRTINLRREKDCAIVIAMNEIRIPLRSVTLSGELDLPPGARGLVLFAHGSGSSRHSPRNQFVARILRAGNMGTLLFDLLTVEEEQAEAYTRHLRFNIPFLADRLIEATRWVLNRTRDRDLAAGYFGSSTGAAAALMAAANLSETISAVVSRGGRPDLAGDALPRVAAPTLLIVGGDDTAVLSLNEEAYGRLPGEKALRIVRGASHLFEENGALEQVAGMALEWFTGHLCPVTQKTS
jgi:putative phosphoribosyl transferase